jgi:hypothetical protein
MKKLTKEQMEIVKREHPEWFNGIEVGKWYNLNRGKCLMFVTGLRHYDIVAGYGFYYGGNWQDDGSLWGTDGAAEATTEEVRQALIAEAKRRYKAGDMIKSLRNDWVQTIGEMIVNVYSPVKERNYWVVTVVAEENEWNEMCSNPTVFKDGQWASVIPEEKTSLQDDIQALKDRWPDINFTVIAEGKR